MNYHFAILWLPTIPNLYFTVPAPRDDIVSSRSKGKGGDPARMTLDAVKLSTVCITKPNNLVSPSRCQCFAIGRKRDRHDWTAMSHCRRDFLSGCCVP